jgi:2-polyprenyl-3-methyl-5-hydroxy-6-metoxy-1,4-benzoquinol methylase
MAHPPCPVCESANVKPSLFGGYDYRGGYYAIVRCRACRLCFVDPMPTAELLMEVYRGEEYFEDYASLGSSAVGYDASTEQVNPFDERTLAALRSFRASGRLLDVGCAGGRFLARAASEGFEAYGVEPSASMVLEGRKRHALDIMEGTLVDAFARFGPRSFDVVHLADVLEHLPDLRTTMQTLASLLRDGGLLVLQQPMTFHSTMFNAFLGLNMLLKKNRATAYPPLHLWEFTPMSLRRVLRDHGFELSHLEVFERGPVPRAGDASAKKRLGDVIKRVSSGISNARVLARLELGDRAIVVARRLGAAALIERA